MDSPTTEANTTPAEAVKATPKAKIVGGPAREQTVPLTWPVEFEGTTYDSISVRRPSTGEIADHVRAWQESERTGEAFVRRWPIFNAPGEVLDAMDADDDDALHEVMKRFLPQRVLGLMGLSAPAPSDGEATP